MDKTMIDKLKQIEDIKILSLLNDASIWESKLIDYTFPIVERLWCQIGNYRLCLHFIHKCSREESFLHPHPWPSAVHVIDGEYEMGLGFGEGIEEPEVFSTIISSGDMYYDMSNRDAWHYVRPTIGPCASVMLTGEPWDREMPNSNCSKQYKKISDIRIYTMLDYFRKKYNINAQSDVYSSEINRGDWVMIDESKFFKSSPSVKEAYGSLVGVKGFVVNNDEEDGLSIRFGSNRYDEFNPSILIKL